MKIVENTHITRYFYVDGRLDAKYKVWYVDVVESDNMGCTVDMFEAWIAPRDHYIEYGKSMYTVGVPKVQTMADGSIFATDRGYFLSKLNEDMEEYIDIWYEMEGVTV